MTNLTAAAGRDAAGSYSEISFDYTVDVSRHAAIRLYLDRTAAVFSVKYLANASNLSPFPSFADYPANLRHVTFGGMFAVPSFPGFAEESPWTFFDAAANAFIVSPAANFLTGELSWGPHGEIQSGISRQIGLLPEGFEHSTLLVPGQGINHTFDQWGLWLTDRAGKQRPANDADTSLKLLGYWTDNGAAYYYQTEPSLSYQDTLLAVKADFASHGISLGYLQLDSWFYPKGANVDWRDRGSGIYQYTGDPSLFSPSLSGFQRQLDLPLITHARWIDKDSPYRQQYKTSGNVITDPLYWNTIANDLAAAGVVTYEQDWMGDRAHPDLNLTDPDAFLTNMSAGMAGQGLTMQYCMATARHFLQSTRYANLTTARTGEDRFDRVRWTKFLFSSRLASALGIWPFSDVLMSAETPNLLLATLSAGPLGLGDPIGSLHAENILRAVRPDGVIVKPDVPITPTDASFLAASLDSEAPVIASAYTRFGELTAHYVFSYDAGSGASIAFRPSELGVSAPVYAYDYFADKGQIVNPEEAVTATLSPQSFTYHVLLPTGPSGITVIGDRGQFAPWGKKRIAALRDDGTVHIRVSFAAGEPARVIEGYSPAMVGALARSGSVGPVRYDPSTKRFAVTVAQGALGHADLELFLSPATVPLSDPTSPRMRRRPR